VRKLILVLVAVAALGAAGTAAAADHQPNPYITCSGTCLGGGGYTGCTSVTAQHSFSFPLIASVKHVLIVRYCKQYGIITSLSIAAHYCDVQGVMTCTPTVAWRTGGGVGSSSATFEAHATWSVTALNIYNNTDVLKLTVPAG
jgi:hypothetical protein